VFWGEARLKWKQEKRGYGAVGVLWWWAEWPRNLELSNDRTMRRLDTAGLSGEAAVKAALIAGLVPPAEEFSSARAALEGAACQWVRQHSKLVAWAERLPVRVRTALAPEAFRRPPSVLQCASPHPPATFGDVRRGEALTADLTGARYRERGHREIGVLSAQAVRERLAAWLEEDRLTVIWSDPGLDPEVARTLWEEDWLAGGHLQVLHLFRTRGQAVEVLLPATGPVPERIQTITEVSSWIDNLLGQPT
jgi:hypothetical protein